MPGSWTQRETFHMSSGCPLKGEQQEHVTTFDVLCDGKPINVQRKRITEGSPNYTVKQDMLVTDDGQELDIRNLSTRDIYSWLEKLELANK